MQEPTRVARRTAVATRNMRGRHFARSVSEIELPASRASARLREGASYIGHRDHDDAFVTPAFAFDE
jgi:hypothetical protein